MKMPFQVSPGVNISEIDLTTVIPAVSTTQGAIAGRFHWGPADKIILVSDEDVLESQFGKPDSDNYQEWFTAKNFLAYGNALWVSRILNGANNASSSGTLGLYVNNNDDYENNYSSGVTGAGNWVGKYPGTLGNSLKVSVCQSSVAWANTVGTVTFALTAGSTTVEASGNVHLSDVVVGDTLYSANSTVSVNLKITAISGDGLTITVATAPVENDIAGASLTTTAGDIERRWEYYNDFDAVNKGPRVNKRMKSLLDVVGFNKKNSRVRLGQMAEEMVELP